MDDDDDDILLVMEYEGDEDPLHELNGLAHQAICGRLTGVGITFGFQLVDAMRSLELDELSAKPYVEALQRSRDSGLPPAWS